METQNQTQGPGTPSASSKLQRLLPFVLLVVGLLVGTAAGAVVAGTAAIKAAGAQATRTKAEKPRDTVGEEHGDEGDDGHEADTDRTGSEGVPYEIEDLVLNPAGSQGARFLMAKVSLSLRDAEAVEKLKARDAEVRDLVLGVLGSRTAEELVAAQREGTARDSLKEAVRGPVSRMLPRGVVLRVSFPRLVVQ
jgi:flagellar basal body-associated protein FliL